MLNSCIEESIKSSSLSSTFMTQLNNDDTIMGSNSYLDSTDGWNFLDVEESIKDLNIENDKKLNEDEEEEDKESSENQITLTDDENESDNEFFDVEEVKKEDLTNRKGILKRLSNKFLHNGLPLYIPITQTFPPYTEDMITHQQNIFESLGTSSDATQIRMKSK